MSTTLTIRNLAEPVKQKLRIQAANHGRSMEAEAREILSESLFGKSKNEATAEALKEMRRKRLVAALGIWKDRYDGKSTDEIMSELRGDD